MILPSANKTITKAGQLLDDPSAVTGLKVFVVTNDVTVPDDLNTIPQYAPEVRIHTGITTNLNGEGRGKGTGLVEGEVTLSSTVALA